MLGPILHLKATAKNQVLKDRLLEEKEVTDSVVKLWMEFGCVYLNGERVAATGFDQVLNSDDLVKVHSVPKRFPIQQLSPDALLFENEEVIAIHKPTGVPSLPVASNSIENCKYFFEQQLKIKLYPLHRLDEGTEGILLFGKNPEVVKPFHEDSKNGKITKLYKAKTSQPVPLGHHTHYLKKSDGKMLCFDSEVADSKRAELVVHKCEAKNNFYVSEIQLVTGRTHQIRCQLAHLGCPILGDSIYGQTLGKEPFQLKAYSLVWRDLKVSV